MERETEQLLMQYLEGELDEPSAHAFEEQLKADASLREEFVRFTRQERVLRVLLEPGDAEDLGKQVLNQIRAERDGDAFVKRVQHEIGSKRRRSRRSRPGSSARRRSVRLRKRSRSSFPALLAPLAAAAVLLAAAGAYFAFQKESTPRELVAVLTELRGLDAKVATHGGAASPLTLGSELRPGQTLTLGTDTQARFQYPDGTFVDLSSDSQLSFEAPGEPAGKHLRLQSGTLTASVTPQPTRAPLTITTELARATVRGTVFTLAANVSNTRLDVRRGHVELERLADSANVMVASGQFAIAGTDLAQAMVAASIEMQTATVAGPTPTNPPTPAIPTTPSASPALRDGMAADFQGRTYARGKARLPYRLFVPLQYEADKKYPLVLFLHGIGEKGTDNLRPLNNNANGAMVFITAAAQAKHPCFMLVPQSDSGWWVAYQDVIPQLLTDLSNEFSIDLDRLYITGLSSGGNGTWELMLRNPTLFAAGVPICGNADPKKAPLLVDVPIWNFHTADDPTMPVQGSRNMIAAIRKAGGHPYYTEYPTGGHSSSWVRAYKEAALIEWLLIQKRGQPATDPAEIPYAH